MRYRKLAAQGIASALIATQAAVPAMTAFAGVWETDGTSWRYRADDGEHLKNTWFRDPADGHLYYLDANGIMQSGWKYIDGTWYFLTTEHNGSFGAAIENGWAWVDGYCYYFAADGRMAASCTTPDGFLVNDQGQWMENGKPVFIQGKGFQTKPGPVVAPGNTVISGGGSSGGRRPGSGSSGGGGSHASGSQDAAETYRYTIRYCTEDGTILSSYEGRAGKDSVITAADKTFEGYQKKDSSPATFHLTMDKAEFTVVYEAASGAQEDADRELQYKVCHIGPQNEILAEETFTGKAGDAITASYLEFDGYTPAGHSQDGGRLEQDGQVFSFYYNKEGMEENIQQGTAEDTAASYSIYYVAEDGETLHTETGTGNAGDVIRIAGMEFEGYAEQEGQKHEVTLSPGIQSFAILYEKTDAGNLSYAVCYESVDGIVFEEVTGTGARGDIIQAETKEFDGYYEIENQPHEYELTADGSIFRIRYDGKRELPPETFPETPDTPDTEGATDKEEGGSQAGQEGTKPELLNYTVSFTDEEGEQIGYSSRQAEKGSSVPVPDIVLDGYEPEEGSPEEFTVEEDGAGFEVRCLKTFSMEGDDMATPSNALLAAETYPYMILYSNKETGEIISSEAGLAEAGTVLVADDPPAGFLLADDYAFTVVASDNRVHNKFTAWCVSEDSVPPEGSVEYTVRCVDPAGKIIRVFTDSAVAGTEIRPSYEITGYDMDTEKDYVFTVTEEDFVFDVLYIPYKTLSFTFQVYDIDTMEFLTARSMDGRADAWVDVTIPEENFAVEGYDLLSEIPAQVFMSGNTKNNYMRLFAKRKPPEVKPSVKPYVVHFVAYQDNSIKIFDDRVGTAPVGSQVTVDFIKEVNTKYGRYEALIQSEDPTWAKQSFVMEPYVEVNEFYVYYYLVEEHEEVENMDAYYSIRFIASDTGSTLGVMTGTAAPGTRIQYRNTFRGYDHMYNTPRYFTVTDNADDNYVTVPMQRTWFPAPEVNPGSGKYDGSEWLMTFTDQYGNNVLPWRSGYTRKGDTLYVDYPDEILGNDGSVYRAETAGPYIEYVNSTVYKQYNIRYRKSETAEDKLAKWRSEAQACFDEINGSVPYSYTITYREEDSWNDVAVYSGVAEKGSTVKIQNIKIPNHYVPDDTITEFVLDEDRKNVTVYCERIDGAHSTQWYRNDYGIRFTDGQGNDLLEPVTGDVAFEMKDSYSYMALHYPDTFRDANGDIWEADEKGPKQLAMWNLDANQFEITYRRYFENGQENFFAETNQDAQRLLREMATLTVDADRHEYLVIGRGYDATSAEVGSVVSQLQIRDYATELADSFVLDGVTYYITRVSFVRSWNPETCTHDMELAHTVQAGCEVTGKEVWTCKKCGYTETTYFQAVGHVDADRDGMCDRCHVQMKMNIGDEITVTWNIPGGEKAPLPLNFICVDTDYRGTGKKLLLCADEVPASYYGAYSATGNADYFSSDICSYLEAEFYYNLSNRDALTSVEDRITGFLTKEEYDRYRAQAANTYKFPSGITVLHEESGADGRVLLSNGSRVLPEEIPSYKVRPVIFMDGGGAEEGIISGRWNVGDIQSRQIGDETYLFRCINDNYKDNSNLDKSMALFVCDTVLPSYTGLGNNEDNTKRDTRFFGSNNNYRYSEIHRFLEENKKETGNLVTMDIGILNEYEGKTEDGKFQSFNEDDLIRHKRDNAQYLETDLFIPSVEEAVDMKDYLWKFNRSSTNNPQDVYDGHYLTSYWLRTPVYGTDDMVYTVNLLNGTIEPHSVLEEYALPDTFRGMEYSPDNGNTWSPCTDGKTVVGKPGSYLVRERAGGESVTPALSGGMYVLAGTTSRMEYSVDGGVTWKACSDGVTAVGKPGACLVRQKSGSRISTTDSAMTAMLLNTTTDMEWSADDGFTWSTCRAGYTVVPGGGAYLLRNASVPESIVETAAAIRYALRGTSAAEEYLAPDGDWKLCSDGTTFVDAPGTYTVRNTGAGTDVEAVKQSCSVGIRPMYAVYQES